MRAYAQETTGETTGEGTAADDTVTVELPASAVAEDDLDDVPEQIDVDPDALIERVDTWVDGAVRLLPNIVVALILIVVVALIAYGLARLIRWRLAVRGRRDPGIMLGGMVKWALILAAVLLGLTIVLPTLRPADLVAGLGIGSVAIGFAFKDILQNWLSGLLLLLRQPFEVGDQVVIGDYEGTVERIETRSTIIRTYDGQRGIIPNGEVYTSALKVKTAAPLRRSQYDIGYGYGYGIGHAIEVLEESMRGVEGMEADPAPEALV